MSEETTPAPAAPEPAPKVEAVFKAKPPKPKRDAPSQKERLEMLRERAIGALISSSTVAAAARKVDITAGTLRRWMADPAFASALAEARQSILQGVIREIQAGGKIGVEVLTEIAEDIDSNDNDRVVAAAKLVEFSLKAAMPSPSETAGLPERDRTLQYLASRAKEWNARPTKAKTLGPAEVVKAAPPEIVGPIPALPPPGPDPLYEKIFGR